MYSHTNYEHIYIRKQDKDIPANIMHVKWNLVSSTQVT